MATTKSIQIDVVGHASTRWRASRNSADADRLNQALSNQRAESVRAAVELILRRLLPSVKILPNRSYPIDVHPDGVPLGSFGVGSREPVLNPVKSPNRDPRENERLNRSVYVSIKWSSTEQGLMEKIASTGIDTLSKEWKGRVTQLYGGGDAIAIMHIGLVITNLKNGHSGTYSGLLKGVSTPMIVKPTIIGDVGEPFTFTTKDDMILKNFDGKTIRVKSYDVGLGYRVGFEKSAKFITFVALGAGASEIKFDSGSGLSRLTSVLSASGFGLMGDLKLEKTDLDGSSSSSLVPYRTDAGTRDGLIVSFPTGEHRFLDLPLEERNRLERFVKYFVGKL